MSIFVIRNMVSHAVFTWAKVLSSTPFTNETESYFLYCCHWYSLKYQSFSFTIKETSSVFKKWPLNLWWTSNKTIMEVGNITKAATFKIFLHISYKITQLLFLWQCFLIFFLRQTLTDDFWVLHKNMNCAFPLKEAFQTTFFANLFLKQSTPW